MVDYIWDGFLLVETVLVDSLLGQIRLDDMKFAKMATTVALIA
jgi:hypothetical protein